MADFAKRNKKLLKKGGITNDHRQPFSCRKNKTLFQRDHLVIQTKHCKKKTSHCGVVTCFRRKGTVVSLPLQLVLIWAWFSGIHADCWTCIMHESVHMHLGHHACPCRNASTTGMQLHLACFNLLCVHKLPWNSDWSCNWSLSLDRFRVAPARQMFWVPLKKIWEKVSLMAKCYWYILQWWL